MTSRGCGLIQPATATTRNCNTWGTGDIRGEPSRGSRRSRTSRPGERPSVESARRTASIEFLDSTGSAMSTTPTAFRGGSVVEGVLARETSASQERAAAKRVVVLEVRVQRVSGVQVVSAAGLDIVQHRVGHLQPQPGPVGNTDVGARVQVPRQHRVGQVVVQAGVVERQGRIVDVAVDGRVPVLV